MWLQSVLGQVQAGGGAREREKCWGRKRVGSLSGKSGPNQTEQVTEWEEEDADGHQKGNCWISSLSVCNVLISYVCCLRTWEHSTDSERCWKYGVCLRVTKRWVKLKINLKLTFYHAFLQFYDWKSNNSVNLLVEQKSLLIFSTFKLPSIKMHYLVSYWRGEII